MTSDGPPPNTGNHHNGDFILHRAGFTDAEIARMERRVIRPPGRNYQSPADLPSASFIAGGDSLAPCFSAGGSKSVPLAHGLAWDPTEFKGHAITLGMTGEGKGVSAVNPAALSYAGNMLIFDPKGACAWETIPRRRQLGQKVVLLDPWNEVNERFGAPCGVAERTSTYNPLASLRADDPNFNDYLVSIADALIVPNERDPFWTDSAREFIAGLAAAVVELAPGFATLGDVRDHIENDDSEELSRLLTTLLAENPKSYAARKLRRFARSGKEIDSIKSTASTQTAILDAVYLISSMETTEAAFDMAELVTGRVTVYVVLPIDKFGTHGRWLRLILAMALQTVSRQRQPPALPILFICDEMGTLGPLRDLERAYGLLRSAGVRCWGFLQDISQLRRDYPQSWRTFIANSSFVQVIQAHEEETTGYISDMLGYKTERKSGQFTLDYKNSVSQNRIVPKDQNHYNVWRSKQREREDWAYKYYNSQNVHPKPKSERMCLQEHPEYKYPGEWVVERTELGFDFSTRHDEFRQIPLMRPQDIADMPSETVLVIFPRRGKYQLRRVIHFQEPGWQQYIRPNPLENLPAALAYARSRSAPAALAPATSRAYPSSIPDYTPLDSPWAIPRQSPAHVVPTPAAQNRRPLFESQLAHVPGPYQAPLSARLAEWIMKLAPGEKACLSPNKFLLFTVSWSLTCPWHDEIAIKNEEVEACRLELQRLASAGVLRRLITDFWERL